MSSCMRKSPVAMKMTSTRLSDSSVELWMPLDRISNILSPPFGSMIPTKEFDLVSKIAKSILQYHLRSFDVLLLRKSFGD